MLRNHGIGTMGGASPFARGAMMQGMMSMMPDSPAVVRKGTSLDRTAGDTPLRPKRRQAPQAPPGSTLPRPRRPPQSGNGGEVDGEETGGDDDDDEEEGTVLDSHAPVPWHSTFRDDQEVSQCFFPFFFIFSSSSSLFPRAIRSFPGCTVRYALLAFPRTDAIAYARYEGRVYFR